MKRERFQRWRGVAETRWLWWIACAGLLLWASCSAPTETATAASGPADGVLILKSERRLQLLRDGAPFRSYRIALGRVPEGPKRCEGDMKTPEGKYVVSGRNPHSQYHLSLRVSYPNAQDRREASRLGCSPGGDIMIHGLPNSWGRIGAVHTAVDWTRGCVAVTDAEVEEIWKLVEDGTPVEIRP